MSRTRALQKRVASIISECRRGSYSSRKACQGIIFNVLGDLSRLNRLPNSLRQISCEDIGCLVDCWTAQGQSVSTMCNKLSALRRLNRAGRLRLDIPSNQTLNLKKETSKTTEKILLPEVVGIYHPIIKLIIDFQVNFGLTRHEAIRLLPVIPAENNHLSIPRTIAHNRKDRFVPIISEIQCDLIQMGKNVYQDYPSLSNLDGLSVLRHLYIAECQLANISPSTPFHAAYARYRYDALKRTQDNKRALGKICEEMGYQSPSKIEKFLA